MDKNQAWKGKKQYFPNWVPRTELFEELTNKIYLSAIRAKKEDCLDLPPLVKIVQKVEFEDEQKRIYEQMKKDFITFVDESNKQGAVVATLAMTKALRLMQICSGHATDDEGKTHHFPTAKLDALIDIIEQIKDEHKFIVWTCFKADVEIIKKELQKRIIKHVLLTGDQDGESKQESIKQFESDANTRCIIANRSAGGVGVNLIQASYSIVFSRNFSLEAEVQSEARNYRGGSQIHASITKIDLVTKDSIEEKILQALQNKEEVAHRIIDIVKEC
jgi:SNF2 family DNA or RNA helicase